jgi:hypothetical protein
MRASTPQNYLEKIFQITYALAPMNPNRFGDYVAYLAGDAGDRTQPPPKPRDTDQPNAALEKESPAAQASSSTHEQQQADKVRTDESASQDFSTEKEKKQHPVSSLPVRIGKDERAIIVRLAPLLTTPRIAKRLVNVYRVIKARKTAEEVDKFEREGRSQSCLLMLTILFSRPMIAAELLRGLHEGVTPFENPEESLVKSLGRRTSPDGETPEKREAWQRLTDTLKAIGVTATVGACAREPREIARYSLVSGHEWHTWRPPALSPSGSIS